MENKDTLRTEIRLRLKLGFSHRLILKTCSRLAIEEALIECNGNQCHAAEKLEMHRNTLARTMTELSIDAKNFYVKAKKIPSVRTYRRNEGIA